jgi:PAS domain S-box-containing protein
MLKSIRVLIVEDSVNDAELLAEGLRKADYKPEWERVDTERDYLMRLDGDLDLIISDYTMPQFNGLRALDLMRDRGFQIPFIIVSGTLGEERAAEALKHGASDYLMKDRTERLGAAVELALEKSALRKSQALSERTIREGESRFRALFDSAHDAIYILADGLFTESNAKGRFMYGRPWEEFAGRSPVEFAPPFQPNGLSSQEMAMEMVRKALAGQPQIFEWVSLHKDGSRVYAEVSLNRVELGGKAHLMAVSRDITDRRRVEEQLVEQAELLDKATDAIVVSDLRGYVTSWNKGAERVYGWRRDQVIGRKLGELLFAHPEAFEEISRSLIEEGELPGEVQHVAKDGHEITVDARWTLLRDKNNLPKSVLAICTDVTEKRATEAQLMRSQRMESIGTLAGGIAHDLNNILTPILSSIEILKLSDPTPRSARVLDTIETSARRGADIVRQVLSFARGVKGKRVEIQPKRLLKDIETLIEDTFPKNIRVSTSLPPEEWTILGDPTLLHQILLNLSVNARDAMPDGGELFIGAENLVLDEPSVSQYARAKEGRYVVISVSDSGAGIPDTIVEKVFEPFFTTKDVGKGTGLGLSTVLAIAKSHNGFVDVHSQPGAGTVFRVFLPALEKSRHVKPESTPLSDLTRGNGETVLVVDDEPSILAVTGDTLEAFGYQVLTAINGADALAVYEKHRSDIAVVLTDLTMPVLDGLALMRELTKIDPELKIIASSGFKTGHTAPIPPAAKNRLFLAKPYTAEQLLGTLHKLLKEPA